MKILDIPKSGKCGQVVAFQSRYGLCLRQLVIPRNTITPARQFMRGAFGHHSQGYSRTLGDEQRHRWIFAGTQVMSDPRLGQNGPLTGQQLYSSINSVRSRVNLPESLEPPARVAFGLSAVGFGLGPVGRRFTEIDVVNNVRRPLFARNEIVAGLLGASPQLGADLLFGASAVMMLEQRFGDHLLDAWTENRSSLVPWELYPRRTLISQS